MTPQHRTAEANIGPSISEHGAGRGASWSGNGYSNGLAAVWSAATNDNAFPSVVKR